MGRYTPRKFSQLWNLADDGETEVCVAYTMTPVIPAQTYGPAELCYPAEGGEIEILRVVTVADHVTVTLTDAEETRLVEWLGENTEWDDE